jgi:nitrite reductase/ring-hydroxylating ferredoxin subunit
VPVGRITTAQMLEVARGAEIYGSGEIRITVEQNLIIPNVPDDKIGALIAEPLLKELRYDPSEIMRGLVSCTGMDYCHFALIETKELALKTACDLEQQLGKTKPVSIRWSGCPAGCGNHAVADIGLLGKNIKLNGEVVEAVDVFTAGAAGPEPNAPIKIMEDVLCGDLPAVLAGLVRHGAFKAMRQQLRKMSQPPAEIAAPAEVKKPPRPVIRPDDIPEGAAKMIRVKGEEMAVFKRDGHVYAIQNICPHEGGQLSKGWLEGDEVVCPLHGYKFDLKTGACSTDPRLKAKIFQLVGRGDGLTVVE